MMYIARVSPAGLPGAGRGPGPCGGGRPVHPPALPRRRSRPRRHPQYVTTATVCTARPAQGGALSLSCLALPRWSLRHCIASPLLLAKPW